MKSGILSAVASVMMLFSLAASPVKASSVSAFINAPNPWVAGTQQTVTYGYDILNPPSNWDYTVGYARLSVDGNIVDQISTPPVSLSRSVDLVLNDVGDAAFELTGYVRFVDIYSYSYTYSYSYSCGSWFSRRTCTGYGTRTTTRHNTVGTETILAQETISVIAPIPVPAAGGMLLGAFALLGFAKKRKQKLA